MATFDDFGLINMNGRVYDPFMSTFLSPDNYIQAPENSQNFNRYAYCLNNPLKYFGLGVLMGAASGWIGGGISMYVGGGLGACLGGMTANAVAQIPAIINGQGFNFGQMLLSGAFSWGTYYGTSYVNWKWRGGNKIGDIDVSFRQFTKMQTLFQRSRAWEREYGGYLMKDGSFKTAKPGTSCQIDLGKIPEDAIASFHTHWDKPNQHRVCDENGNYVNGNITGRFEEVTTVRYHSDTDIKNSGGLPSIVMNRYDASYHAGGYCFETGFIGAPSVYDMSYTPINPNILRYNFGFLFSIRY